VKVPGVGYLRHQHLLEVFEDAADNITSATGIDIVQIVQQLVTYRLYIVPVNC